MQYNPAFVCLLGMGTVFFGLICIVVICKIMGSLCHLAEKKTGNAAVAATVPPATEEIPNRQEFIAAVSAALAEELGEDISAIRILSVKKL